MEKFTYSDGTYFYKDVLNQQFEYGDILYGPVVAENGTMVESSHGTSLGRLKEWITFLRNCGGFKIW